MNECDQPLHDDTPIRGGTIRRLPSAIAGFVGAASSGPVAHAHVLTSMDEFATVYGPLLPSGTGANISNFLGHSVRAFFAEGGTRAYVVRTRDVGDRLSPAACAEALQALAKAPDVSIVAAPGSTFVAPGTRTDDDSSAAIEDLLIRHADEMRYRIALIDSANGLDLDGVRAQRARVNSSRAAFCYPWVQTMDRLSKASLLLPPSGFVAGIYARVDAQRGPWSAPANEVVRSATELERTIDSVQAETLNAAGINTFRALNDRGVVLWGARTASDDPDWKYINVRRYAATIERSIDQGLRWAVFEPNTEELWSTVRRSVEDFLTTEWQSGGLVGNTAEQAYVVRCDLSTMTQQDLDQGQLICLVGIALVRPAEFVIFRIGLWTADHRP